jgi:nitric oxide reductase activation protein
MSARACVVSVSFFIAIVLLVGCGGDSATYTNKVSASTATMSTNSSKTSTAPSKSSGHVYKKVEASKSHSILNPAGTRVSPNATGRPVIKPEDKLGKTSFLQCTGRGFAAFHVYISNPLRRHVFSQSGVLLSKAIARGIIAANFAAHELHTASVAAKTEETVAQLSEALQVVSDQMLAIAISLKAGKIDLATVADTRSKVNEISLKALRAGQPIQEVTPKLF